MSSLSFLQTICVTVLLLLTFGQITSAYTLSHSHHHRSIIQRRNGAGSKVTNSCAYDGNTNMNDGPSAVTNTYTYYSGFAATFPQPSQWISFDAMFEANRPLMRQSCGWNGWGADNSDHLINYIKKYIQSVAKESKVDHRAILAVIMQESGGCLRVPTTNNGVSNPGIMQSHQGVSFNPAAPCTTIRQMIVDGTQGTIDGAGLVQLLNFYGDYMMAFRAYNSGSIATSGDLSDGNGATNCYVSDIANRLMGWTTGPSTCK